jgi:hypothetical protein
VCRKDRQTRGGWGVTVKVQTTVFECVVRVVSHLRQKLGKIRIFKEEIMQHDSKLSENAIREGTKYDKIRF